MKATQAITLAVGLMLITSTVWAGPDDPVYFGDETLKLDVEEELAKKGIYPPITEDDMLALTYLDASEGGRTDLTGLEYGTNLESLNLSYNDIDDLCALSGLVNLTYLRLNDNQISDISCLSGLTNLIWLYLGGNQITDVSALSGLANLTDLSLWANQIVDISPLDGMTSLTDVSLANNRIVDINALASLPNLDWLNLSGNLIPDVNALRHLTKLQLLDLSFNPIADIEPLTDLTRLRILSLYYIQQITDITALADMNDLSIVLLNSNQIVDITPLAGLAKLSQLEAPYNQISDISALSGLTRLSRLDIQHNEISDISALSELMSLSRLYLQHNPLNCSAYDTYIPMIEANNPGIYLTYDPRPEYCDYEPDIDVSPLDYGFGDVEYGTSRSVLITVSNMGNGDLTLESLDFTPESSSDFAITSAPALPCVIVPVGNVDIQVTFTPSIAGTSTAALEIGSDDPDESVVQVILTGAGVEVPPAEQLEYMFEFIDTSVADGILEGSGPGDSADKRLNALINMFEATSTLIAGEHFEDACDQLVDILQKCDGQIPPPDFVTGEAAEELANMILQLMEDLGCE